MKSLSLLKKIALGSGAIASVTPIALMSTSCAIEDISADYIEFNDIFASKDYSKANLSSQSFKKLLFGSKKVHNGNYILFIGSNMNSNTCKFYTGSNALRSRTNFFQTSYDSTEGHFYEGDFYMGIEKAGKYPIKNFGIFNVIDFWDGVVTDNKGHRIYVCEKENVKTEVISPWAKWKTPIIEQTQIYNKSIGYEWDKDSVTADKDYIRNDASAVAFRAFVQTGLQVYPTNDKRKTSFNVSDNNAADPKMLVFVDGKLQSQGKDEKEIIDILDAPTSKDAWYDTIHKYFNDEQKTN